MKFDSIVAFGDSHVSGCEIIDGLLGDGLGTWADIHHSDRLTKPLSFPNLIAKRLNIPCFNYSMLGASNQRTLRLMTSVIEKHPNSLVLFGYSSSLRTEFYIPGMKSLIQDGDFVQIIPQFVDKWYDEHVDLYRMYYKHFYNYRSSLAEFMFCVDSICKVHVNSWLHIPLFPEVKDCVISPSITNILKFDGADNYLDWCVQQGFQQKPFGHYGQEAHDALTELILKQIP